MSLNMAYNSSPTRRTTTTGRRGGTGVTSSMDTTNPGSSPSTPRRQRRRPSTPQRPVFGFPIIATTIPTHQFHPVTAATSSTTRRKQYPVPVAVTLYNLFPPPRATQPSETDIEEEEDDDDDDHNGMQILYRKRNPLELLVPVRLDVVATQEVIVSTSPCETNKIWISQSNEKGITDEKKMDQMNEQMDESNNAEENDKRKDNKDVSKQSLLDQEEEEQESNRMTQEVRLYSCVHARMGLNPKWDLLDERVHLIGINRPDEEDQGQHGRHRRQDDDDGATPKPLSPNKEENEQWDSIYRSMRARFILHQEPKTIVTNLLTTIPAASVDVEGNNVDGHEKKLLEQSDPREIQKLITEISLENVSPYRQNRPTPKEGNETHLQELVSDISLLDLPLHPTLLRRLPSQESSMFGSGNSNIPTSLPPNAVLVDYSDGSTRVNPSIYRLLLRSGVIDEDPQNDEYVADDIVEENKRERRFSDNAFEALDDTGIWDNAESVANTKHPPSGLSGPHSPPCTKRNSHGPMVVDHNVTLKRRPSNESESGEASNVSPLIDDEVFALLGPSAGRVQDDKRHESIRQTPYLMLDSRSSTPRMADPSEIDNDNSSQQDTARRNDVDEQDEFKTTENETSEQNGYSKCGVETEFVMEHLCNEILSLEAELQAEKMAFSNEKQLLKKEIAGIKTLNDQINENEEVTRLITQATRAELEEVNELEFLLGTRQAKLLMDLRSIYPIQVVGVTLSSKVQYLIRGIEVPIDFYGPQVLDEEVSAALGFLCHLVFMVSKYLSIPLRYKVICNSSRSAIQDDGRGIFPLFKERVVEQKQLDRAMFLLHRDVDCILNMRGIHFVPRSHILSKVDLLFSQTLQIHQGPV